jgi:hypothetical protein
VVSGAAEQPILNINYEVEADVEESIPDSASLAEARDYVLAQRENGVECPCCGRYVRVYQRKLNSGMALAFSKLCRIHLRDDKRAVHAREVCEPTKNRDFSQLRFWDLMEELPKSEDQHGRTSGYWLPTAKGLAFYYGSIRVPRFRIHVSGEDETTAWSSELISLREALPDNFDYDGLLLDSAAN